MNLIKVKKVFVYEKETGKFVRNHSYVKLGVYKGKFLVFNNNIITGEYEPEKYYLEIFG